MRTFDHLILNGRPAGGKSELIDFLKKTPRERRAERFHIDGFIEMDDFVWLWDKFVEDDLWEQLGQPRLYSRTVPHGYVQTEGDRLLDMLCLKFGRLITRDTMSHPEWYDANTMIVEFSRGKVDGGYRRAYELIAPEVWDRAAILYIQVTYEESARRNEARYQEKLAHSILAHKLPDEALQRFSAEQDFLELADGRDSGFLEIHGRKVPFVVMSNEPELTNDDALDERYGHALGTLWKLYESR
jgi:hypothetical protein